MTLTIESSTQAPRRSGTLALPEAKMDAPSTSVKRRARISLACDLLGVTSRSAGGDKYGCYYRLVKNGNPIYSAGERLESVCFVVSGTVKIQIRSGETNVIPGFLLPGSIVGLEGLDNLIFSNSAIAINDVLLLCLPYISFVAYSRRDPEFNAAIMQRLSAQIRRAAALIMVLARWNAEARVAFFITELSVRLGSSSEPATAIDITMSRRDIATHLGLAYETIVRSLNKFKDSGLIKWRDRTILIQDQAALRALCSGAATLL